MGYPCNLGLIFGVGIGFKENSRVCLKFKINLSINYLDNVTYMKSLKNKLTIYVTINLSIN